MGKDTITLTVKEHRRAQVLARVVEGTITLQEAATVMDISLRQARRLKGQLTREGPVGLTHGNRGQPSTRRIDEPTRQRVAELFRTKYHDCNVQHFTELLAEREAIPLGVETVRRVLKAAGLIARKNRRTVHRARRARMPAEGMLLQIDGSPFRWLGPDGPRWTLLGAVDDATSEAVAAVFRDQEDAAGYLELLREVIQRKGIPVAVYRDRHGIFEVSKRVRSTLEEDFAGTRFPTQVGRLLAELGIESIPAFSPQAKGRVERSWETHQDRLVAELKLAGVTTMAEANAFLPSYLERYRERFAVAPRSDESAYVPMAGGTDLDRLFCFKYERRVAADNTVQFGGRVLQIPPGAERLSYTRVVVEVHERLDGSVAVVYQGKVLLLVPDLAHEPRPLRARSRHVLSPVTHTPQPSAPQSSPTQLLDGPPVQELRPSKPAPDHPWRRRLLADKSKAGADTFTRG
jgi:transposase